MRARASGELAAAAAEQIVSYIGPRGRSEIINGRRVGGVVRERDELLRTFRRPAGRDVHRRADGAARTLARFIVYAARRRVSDDITCVRGLRAESSSSSSSRPVAVRQIPWTRRSLYGAPRPDCPSRRRLSISRRGNVAGWNGVGKRRTF